MLNINKITNCNSSEIVVERDIGNVKRYRNIEVCLWREQTNINEKKSWAFIFL